ncbi:Putative agmatine deiminase [Poriferisphaera corsica]|uniref:Agmatine deiminase n=1 Tax=Poriferisphaera corsica TaxID=2528020 RepID=A0A517YYV3_9BACT|nr:agmatine deiminase family protein [Poriferisphaera corsica]QDU35402.1 Putative agmatine deiminase [Poriferisphaera corsica]
MPLKGAIAGKHPKIEGFQSLVVMGRSAREMGYRLPAEFERQRAVLLTRLHNGETWPGGSLEKAQEEFEYFAETVAKYTRVRFVDELGFETTDSWIRDYGPISMKRCDGRESNQRLAGQGLMYQDFVFDGWGAKYDEKTADDLIPQQFGLMDGVPMKVHDVILEGGSIEVNGKGMLLTTEQCLLNENRNAGMNRRELEGYLCEHLNVDDVVWLPGGITGDDTDGHVDDIARFVSEDVVVAVTAEKGHADYEVLQANKCVLEGKGLEVVELPMPEVMTHEFPSGQPYDQAGKQVLPASYANFLITNGAIMVPMFGQKMDEVALRVIEKAAPNYVIEPVPAKHLIVGMGSLHCLSMQVPW